jgi:HD-like signal output (HDOD) protein
LPITATEHVETTQDIQKAIKAVRPLPDVALRVLRLVEAPDYRIDDLVALVRTDPVLVARVLRLCNASLYGLDHEVTAVGDAIAWLGSRNLVQMVMACCASGTFAGVRSSPYADPMALWRHAIACAVTGQTLAVASGRVGAAVAFTAGVLHDIGRIALSQNADEAKLAEALARHHENPAADALQIERAMFGVDHASVGGLIAAEWRLPQELSAALRHHHDEARLVEPAPLTALLHVAEQMVQQMGAGAPFPRLQARIAPAALAQLGLRTADLPTLTADAIGALAQAAELMNPDLPRGR